MQLHRMSPICCCFPCNFNTSTHPKIHSAQFIHLLLVLPLSVSQDVWKERDKAITWFHPWDFGSQPRHGASLVLDECLNSPQIKESCLLSPCIIHTKEKRKIKGVQTSVAGNLLGFFLLRRGRAYLNMTKFYLNLFSKQIYTFKHAI